MRNEPKYIILTFSFKTTNLPFGQLSIISFVELKQSLGHLRWAIHSSENDADGVIEFVK